MIFENQCLHPILPSRSTRRTVFLFYIRIFLWHLDEPSPVNGIHTPPKANECHYFSRECIFQLSWFFTGTFFRFQGSFMKKKPVENLDEAFICWVIWVTAVTPSKESLARWSGSEAGGLLFEDMNPNPKKCLGFRGLLVWPLYWPPVFFFKIISRTNWKNCHL